MNPGFSYQDTTPTVDGASGALTESIPIDIPPGRNALQPDLSLDYNSQDTNQDSIVGYGWTLPIPYIERLNKTGSENLYGSSTPYYTSSLDGELAFASFTGGTSTSTLNVLVVAGGGAAGDAYGGGGGGGGVVYDASYATTAGTKTVTVGSGGVGQSGHQGGSGGNSVFDAITAVGGGGGALGPGGSGNNGGSGGGGSGYPGDTGGGGTATQGNSGGGTGYGYNGAGGTNSGSCSSSYCGGGGGGAGGTGDSNGDGGLGYTSSISGSSVTYGTGGGYGSGRYGSSYGGSYGSGGWANTTNGQAGIIIISYPTVDAANFTCNGSLTTSGSNTICTYTSSGTFVVLNPIPAVGNGYTARVDDGSFRQYSYSTTTDIWSMYDKQGDEYLFGASSQGKQSATTTQTGTVQTYKWMLEKEIDPNGNYIRYVYSKDHNQIYPSEIIYTGHNSTDGPMTITFATTTRSDDTINMLPGFEVDTDYLISQITMAIASTTVRQYSLSYTTGNNGYRSLLSSVQESGWNASGVETTLPSWSFSYTSSSTPFVSSATGSSNCTFSGSAYVASEVLGDGLSRSVALDYNGTSALVYITNDSSSPISWSNSGATFAYSGPSSWCPSETGTRLVDINGDGMANAVQNSFNYMSGTSTALNYYVNSGGSWTATSSYTGVIPQFYVSAPGTGAAGTTGLFGDVDGTGLPSYEQNLNIGGWGDVTNGAYLANGSAWNAATTTIFAPPESFPSSGSDCTDSQLVDLTGDGLDDWVYTNGTDTYVLPNNGTGWEATPDPRWTIGTSTVYQSAGNCYDEGWRFVDVNGDGLPDLVRSYTNTGNTVMQPGTYQVVYLNTGHGWATSTAYSLPNIVDAYQYASLNVASDSELVNFIGNGQQYQDVLSTTTSPKGGGTSISYGYTTQSGANPKLPYSLLVVTKVVNHDGRGSNEETDYTYSGGLQYLPSFVYDRKFAGFASVTASTSIASTTTYYSQGSTSTAPIAGDQSDGFGQLNHPYRQDTATPWGTLIRSIFYQYSSIWHGNSEFVGLTRQLEQDYASDGSHLDKDTDYVYSTTTDTLLETLNYGQVSGNSNGTFSTSSATTLRTTIASYAASSSINLIVPVETTLLNSSNATTTDTKYFYDGLSFGQVTIGNETQEQDWVSGTHSASSTKAYNSYGLVATSTDRNGNATTYAYDSYNLYPATTTNALGQSTIYKYNYSNGKVATSTDPNGSITQNIYDGVGRPIETDESNSASPSSLITKSTFTYTDSTTTPSLVHESDYLNSASTTDTYDYYDGLDRLIQERKSTGTSGTFAVTDDTYNSVSLLSSQRLPYFSSGSGETTATTTASLLATHTYDPLQRSLTVANAVGTTTNVYNKWTTTTTDPNGDIKDYILDAFGNLAQVVEHNTSSNATTTYSYYAANNLATTTDALGNIRTFTYDGLGDRLTATDLHASGAGSYGTWTYSYDDQGNEISHTDPKSQTITHTYDALNRMLAETWTGHGVQISDTYDTCTNGVGRLCTASTSAAADTYTYDVLGDTIDATTTVNGTNYGLAYGYDRQGNITSLTNSADGSQVNYTYNSAGLVSNVSRTVSGLPSPIASLSNFSPTNQLGIILFASGASTTYSYDAGHLYRLMNILTLGTTTATSTGVNSVSTLVVAGGGAAGDGYGGGGGGGGVVYNPSYSISVGSYTVTVGSGGTGNTSAQGNSGGNSVFGTITSNGGGGGGSLYSGPNGLSGGSGGGGNGASPGSGGSATQGNSGGGTGYGNNGAGGASSTGGGGGGAGSAGDSTGDGGTGYTSSISGTSTVYATGGGYGSGRYGTSYGGSYGSGGWANKTSGQQGVVVISYPSSAAASLGCTGTSTTSGGNTICTYTSSGTFTVSSTGNSALQNLSYAYDADGNILTRTDNSSSGNGQIVTYTYDPLNRLLSASTTINNTNSYDQAFTYNALGDILTGSDGTYTYGGGSGANPDAVTETQLTIGASAPTIAYDDSAIAGNGTPASSLTFSYTVNSNTNGLIVVPVAEATTSPSCTSDEVTSVTDNGASLSDASYYERNTSIGALKTYYGYSPTQGTHNVVVTASASCILHAGAETFTGVKQSGFPDASGAGNPLSDSGAVTRFQATTTTSNYNSWAMLIGVPTQTGTATAGSNTTLRQQQSGDLYFGDSNGPIAPAGAIGLNWTMSSATHWLANYFSIAPTVSNPGTTYDTTFSYDLNGNLTQTVEGATTTSYGYDYLNRLATSTVGGVTTTYGYDALGNRVFQASGNTTTVYPSNYFSVVTTAGIGTSTVATSTDYVYDGSTLLATIDQTLINGTATGTPITRYNHPDNLGSTNVTSDANGNLAQNFDYAPYGSVLASTNTGTTTAARQFIGQFTDSSGLNYLNARYYQPAQGQFLTEDPLFLAIGDQNRIQQLSQKQQSVLLADPQSLNSYSYSEDNPIVQSDPNGKCPICILGLGLAGGYAYGLAYQHEYDAGRGQTSDLSTYVSSGVEGIMEGGATAVSIAVAGPETALEYFNYYQSGQGLKDYYDQVLSPNSVNYSEQQQRMTAGQVLLDAVQRIASEFTPVPASVGYDAITSILNSLVQISSQYLGTPNSQNTNTNSRTQTTSNQSAHSTSGGSSAGGGSQSGYNTLPGQFNPYTPHS